MLATTARACPVEALLCCRIAERTVRFCDWQSESAARKALSVSGRVARPPASLR